ncbi:B12-binding domain-containing radical SAM protein [Candidatus Viridilinea mediisalina]|uniref:B12-binding domain-containing radical SAM protein n=2 Tax=Candidatus Viridilinea mediisalina TaxID=2024553 RepID=A0A2A6RNR3_9CHLR|nr:B12-binding domain-containing radical SAM protein [Candidatus Viridilinea mediisalina]
MEPLAPAALAGLTPPEVVLRFFDDRMEALDYAAPTDLVALSVETYCAKRAYQIATEYRRRGVPVVMGGFHPTLVPAEALQYAEAIVIGEAEETWPQLVADWRAGRMQRVYRQAARPSLRQLRLDRRIFAGKRYLPVGLVEAGRGCQLRCEFCAIHAYFGGTQNRRPSEDILAELRALGGEHKLIFFVDDNITSNMEQAKAFFRALIPLRIRWVSQCSIHAAHDEEFLQLIKASGCQGLLIGFETLNPRNLKQMRKGFNLMQGGYEVALANLRRYGLRIYATFMFGYDDDEPEAFEATMAFALRHRFFMTAFNQIVPFPGTPLYQRIAAEGRLRFEHWWLDERYRFGMLPFVPRGMSAAEVEQRCLEARKAFYTFPSILRRALDLQVNSSNPRMLFNFLSANLLMRRDARKRQGFPLGDAAFKGALLKTRLPV